MLPVAPRPRHRFAWAIPSLLLLPGLACSDRPAPVQPPHAELAPAAQPPAAPAGEGGAARRHYLVQLDAAARDVRGEAARAARTHSGEVGYVYERALRGFSVRVPAAAAEAIARSPGVRSVRPVKPMRLAGVQASPPWGLDRIDQPSLPLDNAYNYAGTGWNYTAYVFDTGIRTSHVDFQGRATTGFTVPDGLGAGDCNGHGTHVAGTIGGATYGVAKGAQIVAVKVFGYGDCSGSDADLLAGIDWLIANRRLPAVANMSLGFGEVVPEIDAAVENLIAAGVAVVIAAGNSGVDACTQSPSRVPSAVTVAASDASDRRSVWFGGAASNYGACVDLFAPGTDILSAGIASNGDALVQSGTSMAAPHVAGAVAYTQAPAAADAVASVLAGATPDRISNAGAGTPTRLLNTNLPVACLQSPCDGPPSDPRFDAVNVGGPYQGVEGSPISFALVGAPDPGLTYDWDFGDASPTVSGPSATHVYGDGDSYVVRVTARDAADPLIYATKATTAVVANAPPVVVAGNDTTLVAGANVYTRASFTDPGRDDALWVFAVSWGDGTTGFSSFAATAGALPTLLHKYAAPGSYTLRVTVTDKDGASDSDEAVVTVRANTPPVADANGPYAGNEGAYVAFSSAGTSDVDAQLLSYSWSFGDGTTSTAANPNKLYTDDGSYDVTLTVKDAAGGTSTSSTTAAVANVAPSASLIAPAILTEGADYTVSLSASDASSVDRATLEYALDCGQGAGFTAWSQTGKSLSCAAVPDQRSLTLQAKVRDKDGAEKLVSRVVSVTNAAPVPAFAATSATTSLDGGTTATFEGSFTDKGVNDAPWTYTVVWGDGTPSATGTATPGAPIAVSHAYVKPGSWSAYMTIRDKDGATGISPRVTVSVLNDPPVASANGPYAGNEGAYLTFSSAGSSDPNGQALSYLWSFGDGTTSPFANPGKVYADDGSYAVRLIVKDPSGAADTSSTTVTVGNVAPTGTLTAPFSLVEGSGYAVALSGTDAGAADRATLEYAIDCGQGAGFSAWSAAVKSASCAALPDQRPLTVQARVRDKEGAVSTYSRAVYVANSAPVATFGATTGTSFAAGGTLGVQGGFTDAGVNDAPWTYTIIWGDGTASTTGSASPGSAIVASHVYAKAGTWSAYMMVKDKDGAAGFSARVTVTVSP